MTNGYSKDNKSTPYEVGDIVLVYNELGELRVYRIYAKTGHWRYLLTPNIIRCKHDTTHLVIYGNEKIIKKIELE